MDSFFFLFFPRRSVVSLQRRMLVALSVFEISDKDGLICLAFKEGSELLLREKC